MQSLKEARDANPYPFFDALLSKGPVHWDEGMNAWLVVGYDEARYVQLHEDLFAHPYANIPTAADVYGGPRGVLLLQGEQHHAVHNFLLKHFTPLQVAQYRQEFIGQLVTRRLEALAGRTEFDLATEYASVLPSDVIAAMLGLDWRDEDLMAQCRVWNSTMFKWTETFGDDDDAYQQAKAAAAKLNEVLLPVIRARKSEPQDDLISVLWNHGNKILEVWDEDEVLAQARVLFFAGTDTTAHFLKNTLYLLVEYPEYQDRLRGNEQAVVDFGEESLRFFAPVQFRVRVATTDVEVGGHMIRSGDRVHPVNAAANRDPGHYQHPGGFDPTRPSVKDHLAFNVGPRYCVGAGLSRGEEVEVVLQLLDRYRGIRWNPNAEKPQYRGYMPRSFSPLNVIAGRI